MKEDTLGHSDTHFLEVFGVFYVVDQLSYCFLGLVIAADVLKGLAFLLAVVSSSFLRVVGVLVPYDLYQVITQC